MACDGSDCQPLYAAFLKPIRQTYVNVDLCLIVTFSLILQQCLGVCMGHRQLQISISQPKGFDEVAVVVVGRCRADTDDHSNVHVGSPRRSCFRSYAGIVVKNRPARFEPRLWSTSQTAVTPMVR